MDDNTARIERLMQRDKNSMDFVRWLVAVMVIFSHAYPLTLGAENRQDDPTVILTNGQFTTGMMGVAMIFVISGFFVTASLLRSRDWSKFVKARALRIFPGLLVVVLLSMFVLGPLVTSLPLTEYFTHPDTYNYLKVMFLAKTAYFLPGVFDTNVFQDAVNGSLWTLFFSFSFYMMLAVMFLLGILRRRALILAGALSLMFIRGSLLFIYPNTGMDISIMEQLNAFWTIPSIYYGSQLLMYFLTGVSFFMYKEYVVLTRRWMLIILATAPLAVFAHLWEIWMVTAGTYIMFYFATSERSPLQNWAKYGDYSYGVYIFGFPIQQTVTYLAGGTMDPMANFFISLPIVCAISLASWRWVEKPALRLRKVPIRATVRRWTGLDRPATPSAPAAPAPTQNAQVAYSTVTEAETPGQPPQ